MRVECDSAKSKSILFSKFQNAAHCPDTIYGTYFVAVVEMYKPLWVTTSFRSFRTSEWQHLDRSEVMPLRALELASIVWLRTRSMTSSKSNEFYRDCTKRQHSVKLTSCASPLLCFWMTDSALRLT